MPVRTQHGDLGPLVKLCAAVLLAAASACGGSLGGSAANVDAAGGAGGSSAPTKVDAGPSGRDAGPSPTDAPTTSTLDAALADAAAPSKQDASVPTSDVGDPPAAKRDPYLWPFAKTSIWNMPIGSGAVYKAAGLGDAEHVGVDIQHILRERMTDPERDILSSGDWSKDRCGGTVALGLKVRVPDSWIVPDAGKSPYGATPNSNFAILRVDGDQLFQGNVLSRCTAAGPVHIPEWMKYPDNQGRESVRGDGISGGGQGASGMSAMGGTIRLGELVGTTPIRHAIKVNPWAHKYLFYDETSKGSRWPSKRADSYAGMGGDVGYGGRNASLVMGSLLAIPPSVTESSLGLKTAAGKKLFFTLQNYGFYFTEDAAWDTWDLIVERDAELEFEKAYGFSMGSDMWRADVNALMKAVSIVDNNAPDKVGGGGTPRQPLAPDF